MFADAMMSAGDWLPQEVNSWVWNTKAPLSLTKDGWVAKLSPNQAAAKNVFRDMENGYPAGEYLVTYKGKGQLEFRGDGSVTSAGAGWIRLNVKPTMVGVILRLIKTDPADPLRDIRMWLPGYHDGKRLFFQQYLDRIAPFRFIRFMWPQGIVDSSRVKWADRVTPGYATQGGRDGVALEHLIDLANETMADAWFCVPHKADDDYVRRMAALVKARLDPGLRVYLEYSNEVWNGVYSQAKYCRDMGGKLNIPGDGFTKQMRFYSQRSVEIFDIWREVFGSSNRLVCVMATQSVNPWTANTVLQWKNAGAKSDALAIAPYFGNSLGSPNTMNVVQDYSVSKVLSECKKHLAVVAGDIRKNAAVAKKYGVSLISYEGGQHLVGVGRALDNKKLTELFIRVNRAPEMGQLTRQLLDDWKSGGGQEFCVFSFAYRPGKYGSWGILEHLFQPIQSAHKYRACLEFADSNPRWW
ncbi:MAG: hypothetical protein CSA62_12680 [Planctomycetota bacterium]|nr:MAG: hypothetical protein CSA62_12680 [Planctomycetota bacterium]